MPTIRRLPQFDAWLTGLRDLKTRTRLLVCLRKAQHGNLGDVRPVGGGVFEMREHFGPGWRMYFLQRGAQWIVMLGGGDKRAQNRDIAEARRLAKLLEDDDEDQDQDP